MRVYKKSAILEAFYHGLIVYPAPANLTYFWNFGIYALFCLFVQIITGIALAMHYAPDVSLAFYSVEHIMRDVNYGWLLRYTHANGASMFFIVVYIHTFRGLYYGSYLYPREHLWSVGVVILLLMILTAFMGYVLPWGQMSFWGATVITNLVSAVPYIGTDIVIWLWGGYSVDNATLNRFYSFHYALPFIILGLVFVHLIFLHEHKSNNPLGIDFSSDTLAMYPYYIIKDLYGVILFVAFFAAFVFFMPNLLGHPDNYIPANPLVTPPHIVPEWYFLPFYAILRSIPDKLMGVLAMLASILAFLALPYIARAYVRSSDFRPLTQVIFWFFLLVCLLLGWIGGKPVEHPYLIVGQVCTVAYFLLLLVVLPLAGLVEHKVALKG
jgi:ubiquinol-cytochrome c reductase cytochrome b subunit